MSDEENTEAVTEKAEKKGRPDTTSVRDATTHRFVKAGAEEGVTRKALVKHLREGEPDLSPSQAYLTLNRLKAAGKIDRNQVEGEHRWVSVVDPEDAPVEGDVAEA